MRFRSLREVRCSLASSERCCQRLRLSSVLDEMKPALLFFLTACLACGCGSSKQGPSTPPRFSDLPTPSPEPSQPQPQTAPPGPAPLLVYVSGEFKKPGCYAWTSGMTLKDAIAAAGGFTEFAWERIRLQHWDGSSERFRWSGKRPLANNPPLKPGDKVINPRQ